MSLKRWPSVPRSVSIIGEHVSKADLLEAVWDMAARLNPVSCDDEGATLEEVIRTLDTCAQIRGAQTHRNIRGFTAARSAVGATPKEARR